MKSITNENDEKEPLNPVFWLAMGGATMVVAGLIIFFMIQSTSAPKLQTLENALREGAEFDALSKKITLEYDPDRTTESPVSTGLIQMGITGVVRNFTGKDITGLEVTCIVVDLGEKPVREKTLVVIPNKKPVIENNKTMQFQFVIDGFKKEDDRANIRWKVVAVKVE